MRKYDAKLENWSPVGGIVIIGEIQGDKKGRFEDGSSVRTSGIILPLQEGDVIRTQNSTYLLGKRWAPPCAREEEDE